MDETCQSLLELLFLCLRRQLLPSLGYGSSSLSLSSPPVIFCCDAVYESWATYFDSFWSPNLDANALALWIEHYSHCWSILEADLQVDDEAALLAAHNELPSCVIVGISMVPEADVLHETHRHRLAASTAYLVEVLVEDDQFVILGACKIQLVFQGVAKARDRLDSTSTALLVGCEIDLADDLHGLRVPRVQRFIVVRNEGVDVLVQKDVIDQDSVPIIYTKTQVAEFQPLREALSEDRRFFISCPAQQFSHLIDIFALLATRVGRSLGSLACVALCHYE